MVTITLLNQKGGVGKTSTCFHLAGAFAARGLRVLLIDNDPQASLTQGILGPTETENLDPLATIAAVYDLGLQLPAVGRFNVFERIDLVPGSWKLADFNFAEVEDPTDYGIQTLARFLDSCVPLGEGDVLYDVVLIDCPPNLQLCSRAALVGSDALIIPVQAEDYGSQGIRAVIGLVEQIRASGANDPRLLGLLITMFDRRATLPRIYREKLEHLYGEQLFKSVVPRLVGFPEAINRRKPVELYSSRGPAAEAIREVAAEIYVRLKEAGLPLEAREEVA